MYFCLLSCQRSYQPCRDLDRVWLAGDIHKIGVLLVCPVSQEKVTESFIWPTTDGAVSASVVTHRCSATYHCLSVLDIFCCTDVATEHITVNRHVPQHSWFIAKFRKLQRIYLTPSVWASTNFPGTPHTVKIKTKLIGPFGPRACFGLGGKFWVRVVILCQGWNFLRQG